MSISLSAVITLCRTCKYTIQVRNKPTTSLPGHGHGSAARLCQPFPFPALPSLTGDLRTATTQNLTWRPAYIFHVFEVLRSLKITSLKICGKGISALWEGNSRSPYLKHFSISLVSPCKLTLLPFSVLWPASAGKRKGQDQVLIKVGGRSKLGNVLRLWLYTWESQTSFAPCIPQTLFLPCPAIPYRPGHSCHKALWK